MKTADNLFIRPANRMDLQMFSEGEPAQAPEPSPQEPAATEPAQPEGAQKPASLREWLGSYEARQNEPEPAEPTTNTEPVVEPGEPAAEPDIDPQGPTAAEATEPLILGKFRTQSDLANAYQEAQRKISELGQDKSLTVAEMQQLKGQLQQVQQYIAQQQAQVQQKKEEEQKMTPEQEQELFNKLYESENPMTDLLNYLNPVIEQRVKPLQEKLSTYEQEKAWNRQVSDVAGKHADFNDVLPEIQKVIQEQGDALVKLPNAVEVAYNLAKARQVLSKPPEPKVEELLSSPDFIKKLSQNEALRKEILKSHAQQVQQTKPPTVIGSQPGGLVPATPKPEIKSTQDATKLFRAHLNRIFGGGPQ